MKKLLFTLFVSFFVLAGCSGSNVKTQPSITLPYEITNEEVQAFKEEGLDYYTDYQVLEKVTVRDLTADENEKFLAIMENNTLNTLNSDYSAVEFYFGDSERIDRINRTVYRFDENTSKFIYDDEILNTKLYQMTIADKDYLKRFDKEKNEEVVYGEVVKDYRIITIVKKDFIKKGLQFKATINDEVVYIDID
ncbi:hypothetical protein [Enterococcus olivae]